MKVSNIGKYHVVVEGEPGRLMKLRAGYRLWTGTGEIDLDGHEEAREAMSSEAATKLVKSGKAASADERTLQEVGSVLDLSQRALHMIIARGNRKADRIDGPEDFATHDYMGAFEVSDELVIADPCYVAETRPLLRIATPALSGRWHAYIAYAGIFYDISLGIFAVHEDHLNLATDDGEELGTFAVDSGGVVIVDARARDKAEALRAKRTSFDGMVEDLGCYSNTAFGDGLYEARVVRRGDRAVVVRASLAGVEFSYFRAPTKVEPTTPPFTRSLPKRELAPDAPARPYVPTEKYVIGDRLKHSTFGEGVVRKVLKGAKVEVEFTDGVQALAHDR